MTASAGVPLERWVTFDCFGTLVDWHTGFAGMLGPLVGDRTPDVMRAYHRRERMLEAEKPHRSYEDVLVTGLMAAGRDAGLTIEESEARLLPASWANLPLFDDTEPMLAGLRAMGCRLAVLTNCDDALFEKTHRSFRQPFDLVVTAESVRDYKPALTHFRTFARTPGVTKAGWIHVACSWYHDIGPALELGLTRVWVDRDDTGEDPNTATARVRSASEVCDVVAALYGDDRQLVDARRSCA